MESYLHDLSSFLFHSYKFDRNFCVRHSVFFFTVLSPIYDLWTIYWSGFDGFQLSEIKLCCIYSLYFIQSKSCFSTEPYWYMWRLFNNCHSCGVFPRVNILNFVSSIVDGHFGCFQFGAIIQKLLVWTVLYVYLQGTVPVFIKSMRRSGNAE